MFLAGVPLGVLLYYINKFHHKLKVPPVASLPTFLILPVLAFFLIMLAMGEDTDYMREQVCVCVCVCVLPLRVMDGRGN